MSISQSLHTKASQAGLVLVELGDRVEAREGTTTRAYHAKASVALKLAIDNINEAAAVAAQPVAPALIPSKGPIKGSVVKSKYKERYRANGDYSCGDEMAAELRAFLAVIVKGRMIIDPAKLRAVADTNGVWDAKYALLNIGMQRMNIGNRLRSKLALGDRIDIGGAIFQREFKDV